MSKITPRSVMLRKVVKVESNLNEVYEDLCIIKEHVSKWYEDKGKRYENILNQLHEVIVKLHILNSEVWFNIKK
ncbi:MAG: hypothetical protein QW754_05665 [Thermoplasmata archaeon]